MRSRLLVTCLVAPALVASLAGCARSDDAATVAPTTATSARPAPRPTPPTLPPPPTPAEKAAQLVAQMTPQQKAGQLLMVEWVLGAETAEQTVARINQTQAGGVLFLGNGWTPELVRQDWAGLAGATMRPDIGLFAAIDQEGGWVQRLSGDAISRLPAAVEQGAWPPEQLQDAAATWAGELVAAGLNVNLAPVADTVPADMVTVNQPIGALDRHFGSDPVQVGQHAAAFIHGMSSQSVLTAVKHFPGLGRVTGNTDFGTEGTADTVSTAEDPYLEAFRLALAADPAMVMISTAVYTQIDPTRQATFSPLIITDLLRGRLGWQGVVIADSMSAASVTDIAPAARAVDFVAAGGDLMTFGLADELAAAHQGLVDAMAASPGFAALVDQSVVRVLLAKQRAGLVAL